MKLFSSLKNILAPIKCYSCKKEGHFICKDCEFRLRNYEASCFVCKERTTNFEMHKKCKNDLLYYDKIIIRYHYKGHFISKMIKDGKFYHKKDVLHSFGAELGKILLKHHKITENSTIIGVPLHFLRKIKRGYNQSDIIAKSISAQSGIGYHNSLVYRKKYTGQQSKMLKNDRIKNIKNCFAINKKQIDKVDKKQIIIVDDVVSTGATINELSRVLKAAGAREIIAVCIASD